jgi:hypothetical protein
MTTMHDVGVPAGRDTPSKMLLNKRLDGIGWGLFLIMIGVMWLAPERVAQGAWLIGTGALLLALNGIRYLKGIGVSGLTTLLGVVALAAGLAEYFGMRVPLLAICLIVIGGSILLKPFVARTT